MRRDLFEFSELRVLKVFDDLSVMPNACSQRTGGWAQLLPPAKGVNARRVRCTALLGSGYGARLSKICAIRVCQPAPLALHLETTSDGSLMLMATLGFSMGGRPTRLPLRLSTACFSISSVNSGRSLSGFVEIRRVLFDFSDIALPHRDDSPRTPARCICNHHHPAIQITYAQYSTFRILEA